MPVEVALWRMGDKPKRVNFSPIDAESRLEQILAADPTIIDPNLLLIGRQVLTAYGKFIDLLALDCDGNLVVIELKRNRTPREVVAQCLRRRRHGVSQPGLADRSRRGRGEGRREAREAAMERGVLRVVRAPRRQDESALGGCAEVWLHLGRWRRLVRSNAEHA